MDSGESPYLFKETRLNLEPPASASVVTIRVPSTTASGRNQRKPIHDASVEDETTFRLKNLATASSIYRRQWHDTPRSFLWRVLDDDTALSIRAVDVCHKDNSPDASLVLNFHFTVPIQPGCVAFADPQEHDALCVYVLDQANQLYTFMLRPDLFRKRSAIDAVLSELGKVQSPAGLGFKYPHRMVAVTENILLVTVNDGGMIRLDRAKGVESQDGLWKETFFNVQGWAQNLRSLLPFQGKRTIKYGKVNMEYSAATAIKVTSFGLDENLYAVTVCLDHRMRIWNLEDGQVLYTGDILNSDMSPQEMVKWTIDPSQSNLIRIVGRNRGQRICATYSPIGAGEFKFWKLIIKDSHRIVVEDLFPNNSLIPVAPSSSDVWTLADFTLSNQEEGELILWTLWKNNMTYRVQRLDVDRNMGNTWEERWDAVFIETDIATAPTSGRSDPTDVTEKWLQLILQPGKFTRATLETALSIYESGLGSSKEGSKGRGLAESICSVLGSTAALERDSSGAMDFDKFRASSEIQWRRFYRLLVELDKQRGEALGLVLDPDGDMVWVVCTDLLSAVRECSSVERLYHNLSRTSEHSEQLRALVRASVSFVYGFSDNFLQLCNAVLRPELFEESSKTDLERIQYFADKSGFWRGITDEDCSQVVDILGQNFNTITDELYGDLMAVIAAPADAKTRNFSQPLTDFGRKLYLKAAQDNMELQWKVYFSQLVLLVHMEFEFDNEEDALHNRVDIGLVFRQLVAALRRLELLRWLSNTELSVPLFKPDKDLAPGLFKKAAEETRLVTALDVNVGHLLGCVNAQYEPLSLSITELAANLCAPDSDIEVSIPLVQCWLLKRDRPDIAMQLTPFCDQNPFSVYVQGRIMLVLKDFGSAAINFRKAAIGMSTKNIQGERHSTGLLDDTEWNLLNAGSGKYYSHIVALFERQRAYSYVADFARLALQFLSLDTDSDIAKTDMLSRLFNAAVATSRFELAHTSLLSIQDQALRVSNLRKLVDKMCKTYHNKELVALPFPGLQQDVDDILTEKCRTAMDVIHGFPYHQVLYAWRIKRKNYRGAASVLLDRIQKLRLAGEGDKLMGEDVLDTPVTKQYLLLINALSCVDPKQAWVFDEGIGHDGEVVGKRKVVSLADIRKQYQDELDRIAAIQNNQFGFEAGDMMEIG